jgi:dethiobiotin synthetase
MGEKPARGLFVTGTDTGIGKTYVAARIAAELLAAGRRVGVYKPVASGARREPGRLVVEDALALWEAAGRPGSLEAVCPQAFVAPLAPPRAARAEGRIVDAARLRSGLGFWTDRCDMVLVEGAGGLTSPLSDSDCVADLAAEFGYPLIVVAPNRLGVINQTRLTLFAAAGYPERLSVAGVVLNDVVPATAVHDPSIATNAEDLARCCSSPLLAHLGYLAEHFTPAVDWWNLATCS